MRYRRLVIALLLALLPALPAGAQPIDTATVSATLRDAADVCRVDNGALWGRSLCGPIALADRRTRMLLTNVPPDSQPFVPFGGGGVTPAPAGVGFANTAFAWRGRDWAMIMLPLPRDRFDRVALVMHEVFHREQRALGVGASDPANNHLDTREGRELLRLELRALASALEAIDARRDADVRKHTENAMLFRAHRRARFALADSLEPLLEMHEGLCEYTGIRLAMTLTGEGHARAARNVRAFERTPTYVRAFAYGTGAPLGLLLDRFAPDWKREIATTRDPGRMLANAIGFTPPRDLARTVRERATQYDGTALLAEEAARDSARRPMMDDYRKRLVDGPTITLKQNALGRNFDPNALIAFDIRNTVYPTGTFNADWGTLEVAAGGALVANDFTTIRVERGEEPSPDARTLKGPGWTLTLKPGYQLTPTKNGSREITPPAPR